MFNLKYRVLIIVGLCLVSAWALFPRNVTVRQRGPDGVMQDVETRRVPLRRGLDLQGGTYLALEVDDTKQAIADDKKAEAIERAEKTVRNRIDGLGVSGATVAREGDERIIVEIPGIQDPARARQIAQEQAFLEFRITDKTNALERVLPRFDQILRERGVGQQVAQGRAPAAQQRTGIEDLLVGADTAADTTRARDTLALTPGGAFSSLVRVGSIPGEYLVEAARLPQIESFLAMPEIATAMPPGKQLLPGTDSMVIQNRVYRAIYLVDARPIITGEYLTDARPNQTPMDGTVVTFELNNEGGRRFRQETGRHIGDHMAIVLDGRVMGRPPVIQSAIGTRGQITMGGRDLAAAQDLALVLRAGALPVPLRVAEVRNIGPSLGQDSIEKGVRALVIAAAVVILIMLVYYRFSGVLAVAGLTLYTLFTLAMLAGFDAVVTLPGLAGLVLSLGIAVDANVLIFERIREELTRGKTVRTAIEEGFKNSMSAIVDASVTTILTAAVLYQYGTGPVRGFAVTLIAGIVASLIAAIFVVRTFYLLWLARSRGAQTLSI